MSWMRSFNNPSHMQHNFSKIPHVEIPRSVFKRPHTIKGTYNTDYIYPIYCDEVLPGDTFNVRLSSVMRINTLLHPLMDNLHVDFFFFFVPNRLLWTNWKKFMGEQEDPGDTIDYTIPLQTVPGAGYAEESLADYMGIPIGSTGFECNALHFRAYNMVYNNWFRDQNLIDSVHIDTDDGPDTDTDYVLLKRGKRHDYFTSCLPWPQKSPDGQIELPLGESAAVFPGADHAAQRGTTPMAYWDAATGTRASWGANNRFVVAAPTTGIASTTGNSGALNEQLQPSNLYADLSTATASTINELREAFQLQRMMERDARGGSRYPEILKAHFGITDPQMAVLQRPEYLGGGTRPVQVEPIPVTQNTATAKVGDLGALGYSNQSGVGFNKSFTEHGVILGLMNVRADLTYQQGLRKMWSRQTRADFYFPSLAHLGEQEVLLKELFLQDQTVDTDVDGTPDNEEIFGYNERWSEYKYFPSLCVGQMRSDNSAPLDSWHLAQDFGSIPALNQSFIEEAVPMDRVVAVTGEPDFTFDGYFDITCARPMPMYCVPGLIDHF